jgi:hypothetical protein
MELRLALTTIVVYDCSFKVLANGITIVNYDRKEFIVQVTELLTTKKRYLKSKKQM